MSFNLMFIIFIFVCIVGRQFAISYQQANDIRYKRLINKLNSIQDQVY